MIINNKHLDHQLQFIKEHQRYKYKILSIRLLVLILFIIGWEFTASNGYIDSFFFSSPSKIMKCLYNQLVTNHLLVHIGISILETILSFFVIMLCSILIASILWRFKMLSDIFEPVLVLLNSLPKSALAPLIIVWFGTGIKTIVICGISVAIFGCIINLYTSFLTTDKEKQKLIYIMGGNKWHIFRMVILPANTQTIFSNMKVNIGLALVGVMIGEFLAAKRGLGYLIIYSSQVFDLDTLILCILLLCVIAILLYQLLQRLENIFSRI